MDSLIFFNFPYEHTFKSLDRINVSEANAFVCGYLQKNIRLEISQKFLLLKLTDQCYSSLLSLSLHIFWL